MKKQKKLSKTISSKKKVQLKQKPLSLDTTQSNLFKEFDLTPPVPTPNVVGSWAFVFGFVIAILTGVFSMFNLTDNKVLIFLLIICGVIVGFLNIRDHESKEFMQAGAILVLMCWFGLNTISIIPVYASILYSLELLFIPATIIVALRALFSLGHK